ncbi:hypothetical protein L6452_17420 [Arctium lappa]|uniref:Uncharacterized protein n=1 Tax=Arctium lappa TaxID=4217 RepID=A0ACB9C3L0_ARCLA|nr:hypothetical protein L6452_17420 [Arctium lappa]
MRLSLHLHHIDLSFSIPNKMLGKKIGSFKNLAKKIKVKNAWSNWNRQTTREERQRFVIPTRYLSHPLFKMLLEKAHNDGNQKNRLVIPCSVAAFQEVVSTVNCYNGMFDFGHLVEQLI